MCSMDIGGGRRSSDKASESSVVASPRLTGITVDKSVEFSYEELAKATDGFSTANIIGQGGFGSVYYAELRDEVCHSVFNLVLKSWEKFNLLPALWIFSFFIQKAAIKKMDMQASNEFLAELKVLTHVHHLNLVLYFPYPVIIQILMLIICL